MTQAETKAQEEDKPDFSKPNGEWGEVSRPVPSNVLKRDFSRGLPPRKADDENAGGQTP